MDGKTQISLWVSPDVRDWLRRTAFDRKISQGQLIRELLEAERAKQP